MLNILKKGSNKDKIILSILDAVEQTDPINQKIVNHMHTQLDMCIELMSDNAPNFINSEYVDHYSQAFIRSAIDDANLQIERITGQLNTMTHNLSILKRIEAIRSEIGEPTGSGMTACRTIAVEECGKEEKGE